MGVGQFLRARSDSKICLEASRAGCRGRGAYHSMSGLMIPRPYAAIVSKAS